jgi:hypothetical protein
LCLTSADAADHSEDNQQQENGPTSPHYSCSEENHHRLQIEE